MLLTISTTHVPASDLGYLLHKHPGRVQSFEQSVGTAHVFYPESTDSRCTAALLLEVDPIALVRGRSGPAGDGFALGQYVNDRPYAASSMLAMALKDVFRTALTGRCNARPELAAAAIPLDISLPAVPCRGGADLLRRLFEPLGWQVAAISTALDPQIPEWGDSRYFGVRLTGELVLADALNHLYVLLPVLDDAKHYWVSSDEVDKLIRAGSGWLAGHPEKALITRRYLSHRRALTRSAMARLAEVDDTDPDELDNAVALDGCGRRGNQRASTEARSARSAGGPAARRRPRRRARLRCADGGLISAAVKAPWSRICSPIAASSLSSPPMSRHGRCRSRRATCTWRRCPSSSGPG